MNSLIRESPIIRWATFEDHRIRGAFIQSANTILISKGTETDTTLINEIVLEELGHWLESELGKDSKKDEGEAFKDIILNKKNIKTEKDDSTTLVIDGINYKAELPSNASESGPTTTQPEIELIVAEDSGSTALELDINDVLGSSSELESTSVSVEVNEFDPNLGSLKLVTEQTLKKEKPTQRLKQGMAFEPSANANGQTNVELTIRNGFKESSSAGTELSSDKVNEKELEILSDLNKDGVTGIKLSQEIYNPKSNSDSSETPPSDSTNGYTTTTRKYT